MSILDDQKDIDLNSSILAAKQHIIELYNQADSKYAEIVEYLWMIERNKFYTPYGANVDEAWEMFRYTLEAEFKKLSKEPFDLPESYGNLKDKKDYWEDQYKRIRTLLQKEQQQHSECLCDKLDLIKYIKTLDLKTLPYNIIRILDK